MRLTDLLRLTLGALAGQRLRTFLTALGIAVGVAAVLLLTSLGEGVRLFVLAEFTQFGTHLIGVTPGRVSTTGISGAVISNVRPLSLDDAAALARVPHVVAAVPVVQGNAAVEYRFMRFFHPQPLNREPLNLDINLVLIPYALCPLPAARLLSRLS